MGLTARFPSAQAVQVVHSVNPHVSPPASSPLLTHLLDRHGRLVRSHAVAILILGHRGGVVRDRAVVFPGYVGLLNRIAATARDRRIGRQAGSSRTGDGYLVIRNRNRALQRDVARVLDHVAIGDHLALGSIGRRVSALAER